MEGTFGLAQGTESGGAHQYEVAVGDGEDDLGVMADGDGLVGEVVGVDAGSEWKMGSDSLFPRRILFTALAGGVAGRLAAESGARRG